MLRCLPFAFQWLGYTLLSIALFEQSLLATSGSILIAWLSFSLSSCWVLAPFQILPLWTCLCFERRIRAFSTGYRLPSLTRVSWPASYPFRYLNARPIASQNAKTPSMRQLHCYNLAALVASGSAASWALQVACSAQYVSFLSTSACTCSLLGFGPTPWFSSTGQTFLFFPSPSLPCTLG